LRTRIVGQVFAYTNLLLFAKKWSSENFKYLTSWSSETSYELYGHSGLPQSFLQIQSSFPHSTTFLLDLPPLDYCKRDGDATCKDYFPIFDALEYTPKYWEWQKIFWNTTSQSSRRHVFKTPFLHSFLHMTGRWMLFFFSTTIRILLLTCYLPRMVRSFCNFGNWNHAATFLFPILFMMKSSLLLMNLMNLIRKDVLFFQRVTRIYIFPFIKNVRPLMVTM